MIINEEFMFKLEVAFVSCGKNILKGTDIKYIVFEVKGEEECGFQRF